MTESGIYFQDPVTSGIKRFPVASQVGIHDAPVFGSPNHAQAWLRPLEISHLIETGVSRYTIEDREKSRLPKARAMIQDSFAESYRIVPFIRHGANDS